MLCCWDASIVYGPRQSARPASESRQKATPASQPASQAGQQVSHESQQGQELSQPPTRTTKAAGQPGTHINIYKTHINISKTLLIYSGGGWDDSVRQLITPPVIIMECRVCIVMLLGCIDCVWATPVSKASQRVQTEGNASQPASQPGRATSQP